MFLLLVHLKDVFVISAFKIGIEKFGLNLILNLMFLRKLLSNNVTKKM